MDHAATGRVTAGDLADWLFRAAINTTLHDGLQLNPDGHDFERRITEIGELKLGSGSFRVAADDGRGGAIFEVTVTVKESGR